MKFFSIKMPLYFNFGQVTFFAAAAVVGSLKQIVREKQTESGAGKLWKGRMFVYSVKTAGAFIKMYK